MSTNKFSQNDSAILAPYTRSVVVTPNDNEDLVEIPRAIMSHQTQHGQDDYSHVTVILAGDTTSRLIHFTNGTILPLRVRRVLETGTDEDTDIIVFY